MFLPFSICTHAASLLSIHGKLRARKVTHSRYLFCLKIFLLVSCYFLLLLHDPIGKAHKRFIEMLKLYKNLLPMETRQTSLLWLFCQTTNNFTDHEFIHLFLMSFLFQIAVLLFSGFDNMDMLTRCCSVICPCNCNYCN